MSLNLTNQYISQSFQSLVQISSSTVLVDGLGNTVYNLGTIKTGSFTGSFTGSLLGTASYAMNSGGGGSIDTGSFATTGSNTFTGTQIMTGSLFSIGELNLKNPYNPNIRLISTGSYNPSGFGDPSDLVGTQAQSASFSAVMFTYITTGSNASVGTTTYCMNSASGDFAGISIDYKSDDNTLGAELGYYVNNFADGNAIGASPDTIYTLSSKTASGSRNFTAFNGDNDKILELYNNGDYVQTNITSSVSFINLANVSISNYTESYTGTIYNKDSGGDDWVIGNFTIVGTSGSNTRSSNQNVIVDNNSNEQTLIRNSVGNATGEVHSAAMQHNNISTGDFHFIGVASSGVFMASDTTNEDGIQLKMTSGSIDIGEDLGLGLTTMIIRNSGHIILPFVSSSFNYADDAAAATGNVPLGGVYHTSGSLKIRLT
jgi:hypothetical protein